MQTMLGAKDDAYDDTEIRWPCPSLGTTVTSRALSCTRDFATRVVVTLPLFRWSVIHFFGKSGKEY